MSIDFLLQGTNADNHLKSIKELLEIPDPERVIISVAFMTQKGISQLTEHLTPIAEKTTLFSGIRNGITTAQALMKSIEIGCTTYTVDTGSSSLIFHPKIYLAYNKNEARLIVGSANLTIGGLNSNIEASLLMILDLNTPENASLIEDIETKIDNLIIQHTENVTHVSNNAEIQTLFSYGLVVDEKKRCPPIMGDSTSNTNPSIPRMTLLSQTLSIPPISSIPPAAAQISTNSSFTTGFYFVWKSKELKRRDLNIPTAPGTNSTGSMLLKKGQMEEIDHRHHFREDIFSDLTWSPDTKPPHKERAEAQFEIIISGISQGIHVLKLSHDPRTDTASYKQRNSMTQLHWGAARSVVAREELLGRTMTLSRNDKDKTQFIIEID